VKAGEPVLAGRGRRGRESARAQEPRTCSGCICKSNARTSGARNHSGGIMQAAGRSGRVQRPGCPWNAKTGGTAPSSQALRLVHAGSLQLEHERGGASGSGPAALSARAGGRENQALGFGPAARQRRRSRGSSGEGLPLQPRKDALKGRDLSTHRAGTARPSS
jgi:hypothetical protein